MKNLTLVVITLFLGIPMLAQQKEVKKPKYVVIANNKRIITQKELFWYEDKGLVKSMTKGVSQEERDKLAKKFRDKIFSNYITSSKAHKEWLKFKNFQEKLNNEISAEEYLAQTKGYIKDSLQILMVKLAGIRTLDEKNLLEKDIRKNPEYYLDLLEELKNSELDPETYLYFENKIRMVNQQIVQGKYNLSRVFNIVGFLVLIGLVIVIFKVRKKAEKVSEVRLSKQENIIKNLIMEGKTNKEIANELFISLSTVKTHITNIYSKLNISGRKDLLIKN